MEIKITRKLFYSKIHKPILSFKDLEKEILSKRLYSKYKKFKTNITFYRYFTGKFIYKKNCHITSFLKDYLSLNNHKEYVKKLFDLEDAYKNLWKYALSYKEYIDFYCFPFINNFFFNNLINDNIEAKAELYYDIKYKDTKQKKESSKDNGIIIYSKRKSINENDSKNEIIKYFFNEALRKQIESSSPDKLDCSKVHKVENSFLISSSSENAMKQLMEELNEKQKKEN